MKKVEILFNNIKAGILIENSRSDYEFIYDDSYIGLPISLTMPLKSKQFKYNFFPAFFEGLLPEGPQLEALLNDKKINRDDLFSQLIACGADCVGAVSIKELNE
ncbi:MAG: HipA N-terminal domain-containing protein [Bdellovibrionales bacterium]|nr:HipA N-terminal domain-containing protein [Bdellovibrionales bacterium]